jgi:hypothetical protein
MLLPYMFQSFDHHQVFYKPYMCVQFEAFRAVTMKNVVFWDVVLCRSCVNRCFGGTYRLQLQLQSPAHTGSLLVDFSTLKMEAICSPKRQLTQDLHSATSQKTTFFIKCVIVRY